MRTPVHPELAAELARRGLSHGALADRVGCAPGTVSNVIYGRTAPSQALKSRIARELDRDVEELFALSDDVRRLVDAAVAQGLPARVTDTAVLRRVATIAATVPSPPTND